MSLISAEEIENRVSDSYELPNKVLDVMSEPLVTVWTSTYQHAPYIRECIEGILMQKTTFPVEYIIGEDFSTDGTREIVFEYAQKNPKKIRVFTADYNVGSKANATRCKRSSRGKYMAICEGDDCWIDPLKLQKQVDFLEANPDHGMVHTDFDQFVVKSGKLTKNIIRTMNPKKEWQEGSEFVKWYVGGYAKIITCTVCFRKDIFDSTYDIEEHINSFFNKMGDIQLFCNIAGNSSVKYFNESTCLKRVLQESASHSQDYIKNVEFSIEISNAFEYFGKKYQVPESYYLNYQKITAKRIIKSGISNRDFDMFKKGISFKKVKTNRIKKYWLYLYFYLHPVFFSPLRWLYHRFKHVFQIKSLLSK